MKLKIQSEEWFKRYCYQDSDMDWWLSKELYNQYNNSTDNEKFHFFYSGDFDEIIDTSDNENHYLENFGYIAWCIAEIYTIENNPEMFL